MEAAAAPNIERPVEPRPRILSVEKLGVAWPSVPWNGGYRSRVDCKVGRPSLMILRKYGKYHRPNEIIAIFHPSAEAIGVLFSFAGSPDKVQSDESLKDC